MDDFITSPIAGRAKTNWPGENAGRYRGFRRQQMQALANRGYSWGDIKDILNAGLQGGLGKDAPIPRFIRGEVDRVKQLPQAIRKLRMGNQQYSTPPPFPAQGQLKSASMYKQALTSKGAFKKGINQLLNLL